MTTPIEQLEAKGKAAKAASRKLASVSTEIKNKALIAIAEMQHGAFVGDLECGRIAETIERNQRAQRFDEAEHAHELDVEEVDMDVRF